MITTQQLQLLKEGNKKAFEALYRAYNARIYSFVLSMIGDAGVAKGYYTGYLSPNLGETAQY